MNADGGFTQPIVEAERIFGAPIERVEWFAHRLEQELQRHAPLKAALVDGCRGCHTMSEAYDSLLAWLVVLLRVSKDADQRAVDTRREFEEAVRIAFPKQIREQESNPMVQRDLAELKPSTLKDLLVGIAQNSREENYQSGVRYSERQIKDLESDLDAANRRIADLEESVRRFEAARQAVSGESLGVPAAVVDGLFDGKVTLPTFLRQLAGPTGFTAYRDGERTIEVSTYVGSRPQPAAASQAAVLIPEQQPAHHTTLGQAVQALRNGVGSEKVEEPEVQQPASSGVDTQPTAAAPPDPGETDAVAPEATGDVDPGASGGEPSIDAAKPTSEPLRREEGPVGETQEGAGEAKEGGGAHRGKPSAVAGDEDETPGSGRQGRSAADVAIPELAAVDLSDPDAVRHHVALIMAQGSLYTLTRLKASEARLGVPLGLALSEMTRAHLVKAVNTTDGDTLLLPTEAFSRLVGEQGDGKGPSPTHPFWSALTNRLPDEHSQTLLAEALCPFLARNYDLVNFRLIRKEGFVAINMSVPHSGHRSFGVVCVLLKAPPYPAVEIPPRARAVWITGEPDQLAQAPAVREGPDVWHGPAMASFDDSVWTPHRVRPGHTLR